MTVDDSSPAKAKERRCPICGKPATAEALPFCSKRCADVDLHRWFGGAYAIPTDETEGPEGLPDEGH